MGIDETLVAEITRRILAVMVPERVILFGSAATGRMTPDSDIDILVVVSDLQRPRDESVRIRRQLRGLGYPFDIVVISAERFEESKGVVGGIAYPANRYGRTIFAPA